MEGLLKQGHPLETMILRTGMPQTSGRQSVMVVWWWISVPYTLFTISAVKVFQLSPGYMANVLWPVSVGGSWPAFDLAPAVATHPRQRR